MDLRTYSPEVTLVGLAVIVGALWVLSGKSATVPIAGPPPNTGQSHTGGMAFNAVQTRTPTTDLAFEDADQIVDRPGAQHLAHEFGTDKALAYSADVRGFLAQL